MAEAESTDFFLLPEDLRRLQIDLGIEAIRQFASALPYYSRFPERHLFWSSHDDPCSPLPGSIFCKTSVNRQQAGNVIAVPYLVDDLMQNSHFDPARIMWQTCFVGYPGSSLLREKLLLTVAACKQLSSHLDLAPKFHSHLDQTTRKTRRRAYLETLASSLTTLCPRGDGMNSIRFFETLSMGRIPVLISDNCVLPFEELIPFERFVIRIAEHNIDHAPEIITGWIQQKNTTELMQRCREARQAWEEFFVPEHIAEPLQRVLATSCGRTTELVTSAGPYRQQGIDAYMAEDYDTAEQLFKKNLESFPDDPETIRCLALLLNETGNYDQSISLLTATQQKHTVVPSLYRLLGEAYQQTGYLEQAYQQFRQALAEEPHNVTLLMNMGTVCSTLDRHDAALDYLNQAAGLAPESASVQMNLGCVLQSLQKIDEATTALRTAVQLDPGHGTAAWNLAQILLLQGNFKEGFELFEARFHKRDPVPQPGVPAPLWHGESLIDKTIIITTEQAFGDAIQFVRYLPLLARQGARIILYNHLKPLQQLFRSVPGITAVVEDLTELPTADYQLPMLSLPRMFSTTLDTIPNRMVPYLAPYAQKLTLWSHKLSAVPGTKIGLCWSGRPEPDPRRSANLHSLAVLTQLDGAVFYSLQLGNGAEQSATPPPGMRLIDLTKDIHDFEDTAALITQLDLVISVDTSVAHLAGALGKPTFTLLPYSPDWRWLLGRQDCPWYPSMRLFRQERPGNWEGVVNSILIMIAQARLDADYYRTDHHTV